ncbi:hypothetical protein THOM_2657 [Trachipleistophora hominis]|uniref:Uncharacterized protein n=1 Tax=Trachipleistophora hominis TaxID=72359 RepID=L7JSG1_TRAHO|nr:hypothetical protein THOM_2657 [Trachipleistophora hominis]
MFSPFSPANYSNDGLKCDSERNQYREYTMLGSPLNQMDTVPSQKTTVSNSAKAAHSNVDAGTILSSANIYSSSYDNQYMTPIPSPSSLNYVSCQTPSDFDEPFSPFSSNYQPLSNAMSEDNDEFLCAWMI